MTANQPQSYTSHVMISTGLSGGGVSLEDNKKVFVKMQQVSNMLELSRSRTVQGEVGYHLLYHDLTEDSTFRYIAPEDDPYTDDDKQTVIGILDRILDKEQPIEMSTDDYYLLNEFLSIRGYDIPSLRQSFNIHQLQESDFIRILFTAENPELVVFTLNTMTDVFIQKYKELVAGESIRSREFFESQVASIQQRLHDKEDELEKFKKANNIILLSEQVKSVVSQLNTFENLLNETEQKIETLKATIWKIESLFSNQDNALKVAESAMLNTEMIQLANEIKDLEREYILKKYKRNTGDQPDLEYALAEKHAQLKELTHQLWLDQYINPQVSKQNLSSQLVEAQIDLEVTMARRKVIEHEVVALSERSNAFAPLEANLSRLTREITVLEQEYLEMLDKLNLARAYETNAISSTSLKVVEKAYFPLKPLPSKRKLLVMLAAVGSFAFGVVTIFGIEYLDTSIRTVRQAENATNNPVLVGIPKLKYLSYNLITYIQQPRSTEEKLLKESLRSLRNHILISIGNHKSILITSSKSQEGKSMVAAALAITFAGSNSSVLLVDSNFRIPALESLFDVSPRFRFQEVLTGKAALSDAVVHTLVPNLDLLCAESSATSPLEVNGRANLKLILQEMKRSYDYVFFDTPAINKFPDTAELTSEVDLSLLVMKSGQIFSDVDKRSLSVLESATADFHGVVLNRMDLDFMDPLFGDIEKSRSLVRVILKLLITRQFSFSDHAIFKKSKKRRKKS
ncbi:polysaccharide biosynthesis tyrosine autokinase [candidate division KSB1 bacterium]|nr:polysaccharide biosynthesis tyrosine autokinase [candidate division KSB1 bacterium]